MSAFPPSSPSLFVPAICNSHQNGLIHLDSPETSRPKLNHNAPRGSDLSTAERIPHRSRSFKLLREPQIKTCPAAICVHLCPLWFIIALTSAGWMAEQIQIPQFGLIAWIHLDLPNALCGGAASEMLRSAYRIEARSLKFSRRVAANSGLSGLRFPLSGLPSLPLPFPSQFQPSPSYLIPALRQPLSLPL